MARFNNGWVKAWRQAAESDLIDNMIVWGLWHWLLYAATWLPTKKLVNGSQRVLPPGTVVFSPKEVARLWRCSESVIRKWIKYLEKTERIVCEPCERGTVITICNWATYQGDFSDACEDRGDGVLTACGPRVEVESLTQEGKKARKKKEESIGAAVAGGLPAISGKGIEKAEKAKNANQFVAAYVTAYQTRFPGGRPDDLNDGKVRGQILNFAKEYPLARACDLVQVYFQMDTKWFGTKGYDFITFRNNLNKIGQALDSGTDPDGNSIDWSKLK